MSSLREQLLYFLNYWFSSFDDPLIWFSPRAKSRDKHLKLKYLSLHNTFSKMSLREIYKFIEKNDNDYRLFLSIIILLDQVSRQIYRNSCNAFTQDKVARRLSRRFLKFYNFKDMNLYHFCFIVVVFEHSENVADHLFIKKLLQERINENNRHEYKTLREMMVYLDKHTDVLIDFGYYPKRKIVCGKKLSQKDLLYIHTQNIGQPF